MLNDKLLDNLHNEVSILKRITHENVVKIHYVFKSKNNYYLMMDYCNGGNL